MKTIAMLLSNGFRPDPRVEKEALSLIKAGYHVELICWDRTHEYPQNETYQGINITRIHIRSYYSAGSRQLIYLPLFLIEAFRQLVRIKPDSVHCHDLDTTLAGAWYSYWHKIPWIFDAHECYPEQMGPQVNRLIYFSLKWLERLMARKAITVITVGEALAAHFRAFGAQVTIVGNYPELSGFSNIEPEITRQKLGIAKDDLILSYIGGFTLARAILPLVQGADQYKGVTILLAGDGPLRKQIETEMINFSNIRYLGWIRQDQVASYITLSDAIYYGLKIDDGNSQFSTPNTLFYAMAAGKPILTTDVGDIAKIVKTERCGVVISEATVGFISEGIEQLMDASVRRSYGENGKKAVINQYNWGFAQTNLLNVYSDILDTAS